ncbi:transcriptional regulator [Streptomyces sp. ICBB 8177]|uniref:transcriptional regulator n=1 Tax=Streptomyces sp. ICBB 8177 TaxID=563922 RepID=UPI000D681082|nr:transcriptional regulator [Streptomyces sp. ICBB 8177]PWI40983.1 transcriptional regulator [Streptomyces sp. ICBB 8177]
MTRAAREVLDTAAAGTVPDEDENRLVPRVVGGTAPVEALAVFAMEQRHVIDSDRRAFLRLAERSAGRPATARFFASLAAGETLAAERLTALIEALGLDDETVRDHQPHPGCQAYPAYVAWLALNAEPVDAVVALSANFAAWGRCCAAVGRALRTSYGFSDTACGFFDFFAEPAPALEAQALEAVQEGLDGAGLNTGEADRYARLAQAYELMFWNTLADLSG